MALPPQVIRAFLNAGLVYEDEKYHNCVFVGRDNTGQPRFASKRGTYDKDGVSFKRDVLGSDKSIAFPIPCDPAVPWVLVFEAPIDLMSFCTLHREVRSNAVALCGLYEGGLNTYLRDNPHLRHVVLCLDADDPGRVATEKLRAEYESRGLKVSTRTPAKGKSHRHPTVADDVRGLCVVGGHRNDLLDDSEQENEGEKCQDRTDGGQQQG